jgi:hypothetical protein
LSLSAHKHPELLVVFDIQKSLALGHLLATIKFLFTFLRVTFLNFNEIVIYDDKPEEFIFKDPFSGNATKKEFNTNLTSWCSSCISLSRLLLAVPKDKICKFLLSNTKMS